MSSDAPKRRYFAFNPYVFDDCGVWTQRDLQMLCSQLGLRATGTRSELIERLHGWHRSNHEAPENAWPAGMFTLLGVNVYKKADVGLATDSPTASPKKQLVVSPRFLSPLVGRKKSMARTPSSILRTRKASTPSKRVLFSPYNGVHLIPRRDAQGEARL